MIYDGFLTNKLLLPTYDLLGRIQQPSNLFKPAAALVKSEPLEAKNNHFRFRHFESLLHKHMQLINGQLLWWLLLLLAVLNIYPLITDHMSQ